MAESESSDSKRDLTQVTAQEMLIDPELATEVFVFAFDLFEKDDFDGALPILEKVEFALRQQGDHQRAVLCVRSIAECLLHLGRYPESFEAIERVEQIGFDCEMDHIGVLRVKSEILHAMDKSTEAREVDEIIGRLQGRIDNMDEK